MVGVPGGLEAAMLALSAVVQTHKRTSASDRRCARRMDRALRGLAKMERGVFIGGQTANPQMADEARAWFSRTCGVCGRCPDR